MLSVHQPDPPGLIHDDPRLLPPWRGSSFFCGRTHLLEPHNSVDDPPTAVHPQRSDCWLAAAPPADHCVGMASGATVLTVISDPKLAESADRVAAAVGVRVVRRHTPNSRGWLSAAAVILDDDGAHRCARDVLPRRDAVFLVGAGDPSPGPGEVAIAVGAQHLFTLPAQEAQLVHRLSEAAESGHSAQRRGRSLAVIAGRGGGGASVFATALARCAGEALLVDLDPCSGGVDLLLGAENSPGLRWPDLRVQDGRLTWAAVRQALPSRDHVLTLSAARTYHEIEVASVNAVTDAGLRGGATVICDVPRHLSPASAAALEGADMVVIITSCDVRGIAATAALAGVLRTVNANLGLVVRGPAPGGLRPAEVARAAALPLLAAMRPEPGLDQQLEAGGWRMRRRSPLTQAARTVLAAVRSAAG